jgi:membrane protein
MPYRADFVRVNIKQILALVKAAFSSWVDDYAQSMGAALAYYTMFSIAPLLLIVISIAGLIFGAEAARGEIIGQLQSLMGEQGAQAVQGLLESVSKPAESATATIVGVVLLLIGATTVFTELQDALDRIWRAPERDRSTGIWGLIRSRLLSFGMILGIGFLLTVSLVFSAALAALGKWWGPLFAGWEALANLVNFSISFALTTAVFAMIYKIMPRVHIRWHDVWIGAAVTALLFTIGKFLIGLYIGKSGVTSGFGAAGSLVVVLVWVYYSAQIFLMGADFTWVYSQTFESRRRQSASDTATNLPKTAEAKLAPTRITPAEQQSAPLSRAGKK